MKDAPWALPRHDWSGVVMQVDGNKNVINVRHRLLKDCCVAFNANTSSTSNLLPTRERTHTHPDLRFQLFPRFHTRRRFCS